MSGNNRIVTCKGFSVVFDPERTEYPIDQGWDDNAPTAGQRVTLKVKRTKRKFKLLNGRIGHRLDACTCGSCDFLVRLVFVPNAHKEAALKVYTPEEISEAYGNFAEAVERTRSL